MPVVTRSCGRQGVRRRIEDTTPRRPCQTTVKRKKEICASDEDYEKPAKKKHSDLTVRLDKISVSRNPTQGPQGSKIPRPCTVKKTLMEENNSPQTSRKGIHTTFSFEKIQQNSQQLHVSTTETPNIITPVAARTRSFSALKRSYIAKKSQRNIGKPILSTSLSEVQENNVNAMTESKVNNNVDGIGVAFNKGNDDVEMREEQGQIEEVSEIEQITDEFYKMKFLELVHHVKGLQESFNNAQKNATKNIEAYDALIKELKESLENEMSKVNETTQQLQIARDQLLAVQEQLEKTSQKTSDLMPNPLNSANEKVDDIPSVIQFYQMLSGISLTEEPDPVCSFRSYLCVYKPKGFKGKAMKFRLTYDREIEEVEFSPVVKSPSSGEFLQKLPKCLRENIYFSTDQAPGFLLRLIKSYQNQY